MLYALLYALCFRGLPFFPLFSFGVGPHKVFEFSGVNLKNGLKIGLKTMVLVEKCAFKQIIRCYFCIFRLNVLFGAWSYDLIESSGVKLKNGLKIGLN